MANVYVVINRPNGQRGEPFVLYVAMAESRQAALEIVRSMFRLTGDLEVNGDALAETTVEALALQPGETRRL
jgi:hypothetical protein